MEAFNVCVFFVNLQVSAKRDKGPTGTHFSLLIVYLFMSILEYWLKIEQKIRVFSKKNVL